MIIGAIIYTGLFYLLHMFDVLSFESIFWIILFFNILGSGLSQNQFNEIKKDIIYRFKKNDDFNNRIWEKVEKQERSHNWLYEKLKKYI